LAENLITFTASLELWTGSDRSWHFISVPSYLSGEIKAHALGSPRGFRSAKVGVKIREAMWETSIFPSKDGGYFLPVKIEIIRQVQIAVGGEVTVELTLL
jgi:hypothetical protein